MQRRSSSKRTDLNQTAKAIVDAATGEPAPEIAAGSAATPPTPADRRAAAAMLGRLGGKKGGKARAASLTPERRAEIARKAAKARWAKRAQ